MTDITLPASHPDPALLTLIQETKVEKLCRFDGCVCGAFSVRNVSVEISCRERTIWVWSNSLDYWDTETPNECRSDFLLPIAQEVAQQLYLTWPLHKDPFRLFIEDPSKEEVEESA